MKIKVTSEDELLTICADALHVLTYLRKYTKLWEENYGVELKTRKKHYEKEADKLIEQLQLKDHKYSKDIKIEINHG